MSLANFATTDDVAALLQRDLTSAELAWGNRLLTQASDIVRRYTRQTLNFVSNDTIVLPGTWGNTLTLPQRPISAVNSVLINGVAPTGYTVWKVLDDTLYISTGAYQPDYGVLLWGGSALYGPAGSNTGPQATGSTWQGPNAHITVNYDHGYSTIPGDITNVTAGLVALAIASPVGVEQERVGNYQVKYTRSETGSMVLQAADKEVLNFYRKRTASPLVAVQR